MERRMGGKKGNKVSRRRRYRRKIELHFNDVQGRREGARHENRREKEEQEEWARQGSKKGKTSGEEGNEMGEVETE